MKKTSVVLKILVNYRLHLLKWVPGKSKSKSFCVILKEYVFMPKVKSNYSFIF
jgi:hypothetical protein